MPQAAGEYGIGRDSSEFGRVAGFSDAIFAIAMTLLVLQIDVSGLPEGTGGSARDMLEALADALPEIVSFAVSFYVIGRYWLAHHWFYSRLQRLAACCRRTLSTSGSWPSFRSRPRSSASTSRTRSPSSSSRSRWRR